MYPNFDDPYTNYNPGGDPYVEPEPQQEDPNAWLYDQSRYPTKPPPLPNHTWMWNGNQWTLTSQNALNALGSGEAVNPFGTPTPAATQQFDNVPTTYGGQGGGGGGGGFDPSGFAWPQFNAPKFGAPAPFGHPDFAPPSADSIFSDPSYKMRRDEGLQAIEHGAAAKGLTRLPNTLKALAGWNQDFASREYGNIFDRSLNTYDTNRNNAANTYATNYGISRDVFDRDYQGQSDMFKMNQYEPSKLTFEDMYRRWRDELDSTTQIATAGANGY